MNPDALPLRRTLGLGYGVSVVIAGVMAIVSVAGLLFGYGGLYGTDTALMPAFLGQDLLNLIVGEALLLVSMWLAVRGSLVGLLMWPGSLLYVTYDYGFYVLAAPFGPLFLAYIALVTMSAYTAVGILVSIDGDLAFRRFAQRVPSRVIGGTLIVIALLFIALWTMLSINGLSAPGGLGAIPRSVVIMDFTVQLPALLVAGVLLWRRRPFGYVAVPGLLLQLMAYLLGLSAICLLGRDATGALVTPQAYLPGLVFGGIAFVFIGSFVHAAADTGITTRAARTAATMR